MNNKNMNIRRNHENSFNQKYQKIQTMIFFLSKK